MPSPRVATKRFCCVCNGWFWSGDAKQETYEGVVCKRCRAMIQEQAMADPEGQTSKTVGHAKAEEFGERRINQILAEKGKAQFHDDKTPRILLPPGVIMRNLEEKK